MDSNPYAAPQAVAEDIPGHREAPAVSPYGPYRKVTGWARAILVFLSLSILAAAGHIYTILAVTEANLLYEKDEQAGATVDRWIDLSSQIRIIEFVIFVITATLWCIWTNKSCKNAWLFRPTGVPRPHQVFTPGWAVGWYFIPLFHLWKPFQVMRFIRDSVSPYFKGGAILGIWWTGWIGSTIASRILTRDRPLSTMDEVNDYNEGLMIDSAFTIGASILAGIVILTMTSAQQKAAADLATRRE